LLLLLLFWLQIRSEFPHLVPLHRPGYLSNAAGANNFIFEIVKIKKKWQTDKLNRYEEETKCQKKHTRVSFFFGRFGSGQ
jgi:hypothetical protein